MIDKDIRQYVIKPSLQAISAWSESAELLVYGTGAVETDYKYLMQIGAPKNGGISPWQLEPSDYNDVITWLKNGFNKQLSERVLAACYYACYPSDPMAMVHNLRLACLICRVHYYRIKEPLPAANDAAGMANYHKKYYNSSLGAADVAKNTVIFQNIINADS